MTRRSVTIWLSWLVRKSNVEAFSTAKNQCLSYVACLHNNGILMDNLGQILAEVKLPALSPQSPAHAQAGGGGRFAAPGAQCVDINMCGELDMGLYALSGSHHRSSGPGQCCKSFMNFIIGVANSSSTGPQAHQIYDQFIRVLASTSA